MDNEENKPVLKNYNFKENFKKYSKILSDKKIQIFITIILFSIILISSTNLRLQNLELLKDSTTGKYIPSDPDACYELRVAQTLLETGNISGIDEMRNPGLNLGYTQELLPKILVLAYKILNPLNPAKFTLDYIDVMYPNVAFALSIILFFILSWYVTKSKFVGIIASAILAYSPSYLSRTMTGISSHEALGMPFFFLTLLTFVFSLKNYNKDYKKLITLGILTGISLTLSIVSWSGASNFAIMIIPLTLVLYYFFGGKEMSLKEKEKFIIFNLIWVLAAILITPAFSNPFSLVYLKFTTNFGIIIPAFILFVTCEYFLSKFSKNRHLSSLSDTKKIILSLILTLILGILGLFAIGRNPFEMLYGIYHQMLFPMGQSRVGLTVAYYSQPYLQDVISQYTPLIFWLAIGGIFFLILNLSKKINSKKYRFYFVISLFFSIIGLLFTRYSANSLFNGTNFISQLIYFVSFILILVTFGGYYLKKKFIINTEELFLFAYTIIMMISLRSAVRVLFLVFCFIAIMAAYCLYNLWEYSKKSKEELTRWLGLILFLVLILGVLIYLFGNPLTGSPGTYQIVSYSAKYSGPIADSAWQNAMKWVRENTSKEDIFIHWWDYGYLVQLIGERTSVLDGGNANAYWNHLMGRYVLTTPFPETALSFMKTHNVSYLLIDPTDLGKYAAYSKIGSDNKWDRFSYIDSYLIDESQTRESSNRTTRVYTGVTGVDEDIYLNENQVIIPGPTYNEIGSPDYKAYVIGIIQSMMDVKDGLIPSQPIAIIYYNNKQIQVPLRYNYINGELIDHKTGINATFFVYPSISENSINFVGAGIYLSPKVSSGLFAKLYLMNDPLNEYPTIKLVEKQSPEIVKLLNLNGIEVGDFVYNNGFNGPVKIWKVDYPEDILSNEEFMKLEGEYGELDNLKFVND